MNYDTEISELKKAISLIKSGNAIIERVHKNRILSATKNDLADICEQLTGNINLLEDLCEYGFE